MKLINPVSQTFLRLEDREQPMHVGGLQLFTLPKNADRSYIRDHVNTIRGFTDLEAPFNYRVRKRFGQYFWEDDTDLDLEYHVRHLALPEPGEIRELLALVSLLHGALLDRSRPMWEVYVIEGVTGDRFAVYTKFHHSLMDGVSAMRLLTRSMLSQPDATTLRVPWQLSIKDKKGGDESTGGSEQSPFIAGLAMAGRTLSGLPRVGREIVQSLSDTRHDPDFMSPLDAPRCILNQRITGARRYAADSYSLARIKRLAEAYDGTVNDIVLAMCASALRRYLLDRDALPTKPLVTMIPMSLHDDDSDAGNKVGLILASLATDITDPIERLTTIQRSVNHWKRRYKTMRPDQIMAFIWALSLPASVNLMTGVAPRYQSFNVVISNIPGPQQPLYFADARLEGMYPVSIVLDGQALNITITGYQDKLEFGLLACRRTLPSMQHLLQYLADALDELDTEPGGAA